MTERIGPADLQGANSRRWELREELAQIPELLNEPPQRWIPLFVKRINQLQKNLEAFAPETQGYLRPALTLALGLIKGEQTYSRTNQDDPLLAPLREAASDLTADDKKRLEKNFRNMRGIRADHLIMAFSRMMAEPFGQELVPVNEIVVPMAEIVAGNPNNSRLVNEHIEGHDIEVAYFKHPFRDDIWQKIPLPFDDSTAIKGGGARIINGFYAGAPDSTLAAEIPLNDTDLVIATSGESSAELINVWAAARILGADQSGVEIKSGNMLDYQDYANSRDMTINMSWVARDGLHTCPQAIESARTGITDISGNYRPDKSIYNTDRFTFTDNRTGERIIIPKQRGISRLVKATAEGKILGFNYRDISANTPLGIYALWLVKRWHKFVKPGNPQYNPQQFGEFLNRMFFLAKELKHVPTGISNVIEYLDNVHASFPYFDFRRDLNDMIDIVRWKGKRLAKQLDREYAWSTGVPSDYEFYRQDGDTVSRVVTLDNYVPDTDVNRYTVANYPYLRDRCDQRSDKYNRLNLRVSQKYFFDLNLEDDPIGEDI